MRMMTNGRSIGDLFKSLKDDATWLIKQEIALAKLEISNKLSQAARDSAMMIVGGVVALLGAMALVAAASIGLSVALDLVLPLWLAIWLGPLVVGVLLMIIGYAVFATGRKKLQHIEPKPQRTVQTIKEDTEWVREKVT